MTVERAVILARGLGTRMRDAAAGDLAPDQASAAASGAKAMMPLGATGPGRARRPLLDYILSALADAGYTDACLVVAPDHQAIADYYAGPGRPRRIRVAFAIQEAPRGTADAVLAAHHWTGDDSFLVINGDNYYAVRTMRSLVRRSAAAALYRPEELVARSNIPRERIQAFALCAVEGGRLVRIIEKPTPAQAASLPGPLVSMSCWRMPPAIHDACRAVTPSVRGELELNDAVNALIGAGVTFEVVIAEDGVLDLSRRGDVAAVERALAGVTVDP